MLKRKTCWVGGGGEDANGEMEILMGGIGNINTSAKN